MTYLTPAAAGRQYPSASGRGVGPHAVTRHMQRGVKLRSGGRLRLRGVKTPAGWLTTPAWIAEFLEALTADRSGAAAQPGVRARAAKADAILAADGW